MNSYDAEPKTVAADPRENLVAKFLRCEQALNRARAQREELTAQVEKLSEELRRMRDQIGFDFGITEHAEAQKAAY